MFIFLPMYCFGYNDACTNPQEFTVDKRCYVRDEQKQESPYNSVVALVDKNTNDTYCTGTIVQGKDGKPYLYTAKHCTDHNDDNISDDTLIIQLQDGREFTVDKNNTGNFYIKNDQNKTGDWAVYSINTQQNVPMVDKTSKIKIGSYVFMYDASLVGYGALKIMSDKEIDDFKESYINYLRKQKNEFDEYDKLTKALQYGLFNDSILLMHETVKYFLHDNKIYWYSLENDVENLKISFCRYSSTGLAVGCQGWGGNSGGPIFDTNGNIMGIATRGDYSIGGNLHGHISVDVSLLKSIF